MGVKYVIEYYDLEFYNWVELGDKYGLDAISEFNFLELFLNKFGIEKIDEIKGAYAFVCFFEGKYFVFRDIVGVKPICLFFDVEASKFEFGCCLNDLPVGAYEMNPRKYVVYNVGGDKLHEFDRCRYYDVSNEVLDNYDNVKKNVLELFRLSVKRRVFGLSGKKIGVLFSGGTDSTLMSLVLKDIGIDFTCYTASIVGGNVTEGIDVFYARQIAKESNFDWKLCELDMGDVEVKTKEIISIIGTTNYVKVSVALPLFVALEQVKKDGVDFVFSGIGSEEIFADYKRNDDVLDINGVCIEGLKSLWIRDLYRDDMLARANGLKLRYPFLDDDFIDYSIRINPDFKIDKLKGVNKVILRDILRGFGLSEKMVSRKKKAAQYGSRSDRVFEKICRGKKVGKQEYLDSLDLD